jgi:hypothetical protein
VKGGPKYDPTNKNYGDTSYDGSMKIGPRACTSPDNLASTLVHETTHANQAAAQRAADPTRTDWSTNPADVDYDEAQAYKSELDSAHNTGLDANPKEYGVVQKGYNQHNNALSPARQSELAKGTYPP